MLLIRLIYKRHAVGSCLLQFRKEVVIVTNRIFYHKVTGTPVQIVARAQTKPTFQDVICYQELEKPYDHYVMEKRQFFAEYVKDFVELPLKGKVSIEKRQDLPDKQPLISKGEILQEENPEKAGEDMEDEKLAKLLAFLDAETYGEKIKILEEIKDELDQHLLNNIAVSLDLSLEDGMDSYERIMSELRLRKKYELDRGEHL